MTFNLSPSPVSRLVEAIAGEATRAELVVQFAVALGGIALGWWIARSIRRRVRARSRWQFGKGDFERVAFPLFALAMVALGKLVLSPRA